jgi:hypothetical protein
MKSKSEKLAYDCRYTAGTYADCLMSLPIGAAKGIYAISSKISKMTGKKTLAILSREDLANSPVFQARERLRKNLDTQPGMKYIVSNLVAVPPFYLAGIPIAEGLHNLANDVLPNMPVVLEYIINSAGTIFGQFAVGYSTYQIADIVQNTYKYRNDKGNLSPIKMLKGYWETTKAFIKFDVPYIAGKIAGQSTLRAFGKDPGIASVIFDSAAIPLWYLVAIPWGIRNNLIDNQETRRRKSLEEIDNKK